MKKTVSFSSFREQIRALILSGLRNTTTISYSRYGVLHSYAQSNTEKIMHNLSEAVCRGVQIFTPRLTLHPFAVILCLKQNSDTNYAYLHTRQVFISICMMLNAFVGLIRQTLSIS